MGTLSALVVGPCVAAPLAGALLFIAQTGDATTGGLALFVMGLGMGVPLLLVGTSASQWIPKTGPWMHRIKVGFGFLMLLMAVWMTDRVWPEASLTLLAIISLVMALLLALHHRWQPPLESLSAAVIAYTLALFIGLYGIALFVGQLAGTGTLMQPIGNLGVIPTTSESAVPAQKLNIVKVLPQAIEPLLLQAKLNNQPVMLDFYADNPKMCKYVDMPLQHIADPVLIRMKRATTTKKTLDLLDTLRQRMPGVGLRSSFIVGFPGESDADFEQLLKFVENTRFDNATCFLYSDEEGTPAFELDGKVPEDVVRERYRRLTELQERISGEINHAMVGSQQTVLIDAVDENTNVLTARLQRDAPEIDGHVAIETEPEQGLLQIDGSAGQGPSMAQPGGLVGRFAEVEIIGAYPYELTARLNGEVW